LIVASPQEYQQTVQLIKEAGLHERILGRVAVSENDGSAVGYWKKLPELSSAIPFKEVIFCEGSMSFSDIILAVQQLPPGIRIKFHGCDSSSIVGSDSKDTSGEAMSIENGFKLSNPYNRRLKRLIDIFISFLVYFFFLCMFLLLKSHLLFLQIVLSYCLQKKTWVGYAVPEKNLPALRKGIVACNGSVITAKYSLPAEKSANGGLLVCERL
jgi:hypothetical protein